MDPERIPCDACPVTGEQDFANAPKIPHPQLPLQDSALPLGLQARDRKQPRRRHVGKPALPSSHPSADGGRGVEGSQRPHGEGNRVSGAFKFLGCEDSAGAISVRC